MADGTPDTSYRTPRDVRINGNPPRIPPLKPEEFTDEVREMTANLQRAAGVPVNGYVPDFIATMLRYPELHTVHTDLAILLMAKGTLSARDRELAVCRVGWLCQAPFEWNAHVDAAKRQAGMTDEEIEWVIEGPDAPGWSEHDAAILRAVDELRSDSMISDGTWAVLSKTLDYKQLLEFPILIGQYMGVAFIQNSIRVNLMPGHVGLSAR
jgi:alkylhydroperoxidase family enzyme